MSVNKKSRFEHLESVKNESRTMVFYEAPHKLLRTLKDFYKIFGNRKISIVRELTKVHEEVVLTTIKDAIDKYENEPIRGEFVLVVDGKKDSKQSENITLEMAVEMARRLLNEGYTVSDAAKQIAKKTSLKKSDIYKGILEV